MRRESGLGSCLTWLAFFALSLFLACQKPAPPSTAGGAQTAPDAAKAPGGEDVEAAVRSYLETVKNVDTAKMTIAFKDVRVEGDKAVCQAEYTLKEGGMPPLAYRYELSREGGCWKVVSSKPVGNVHGASAMPPTATAMPPGHPPVGSGAAQPPDLAPAHAPTGGAGK